MKIILRNQHKSVWNWALNSDLSISPCTLRATRGFRKHVGFKEQWSKKCNISANKYFASIHMIIFYLRDGGEIVLDFFWQAEVISHQLLLGIQKVNKNNQKKKKKSCQNIKGHKKDLLKLSLKNEYPSSIKQNWNRVRRSLLSIEVDFLSGWGATVGFFLFVWHGRWGIIYFGSCFLVCFF